VIRSDVQEEDDFLIVPDFAWKILADTYKIDKDAEIKRYSVKANDGAT
jgi:hypothetical protein